MQQLEGAQAVDAVRAVEQLDLQAVGYEELTTICRLRQHTTMTLKWIAERLQMGVGTHVSNLLKGRQSDEAA